MASRPISPREPVAVVLGTRPEIIKLGHLIRLLGPRAWTIHTGQHFDVGLSRVFFDAFGIPEPETTLGVGGSTRGAQIGDATRTLDRVFGERRPSAVIVQGDTNSALAGALAANARGLPLIHVEAGLRSFDRAMPEEHNRVLADHLADMCCAPTEGNRDNLIAERIPQARITVTGNTVVEAVTSLLPDSATRIRLAGGYGVTPNEFILSTFHRPENVDNPAVLSVVLDALGSLPLPVVLPMHPRTRTRVRESGFIVGDNVTVVPPLGYPEFLGLAASAAILVSDSGGIQEEASVLKRPVLVVRRSTERPEVIGTFAERVEPGPVISEVVARWVADLGGLHARLAALPSPYGDGTASRRIADIASGMAS